MTKRDLGKPHVSLVVANPPHYYFVRISLLLLTPVTRIPLRVQDLDTEKALTPKKTMRLLL